MQEPRGQRVVGLLQEDRHERQQRHRQDRADDSPHAAPEDQRDNDADRGQVKRFSCERSAR